MQQRSDEQPRMNIFFDVDYTILGLDYSLRPRTREVFERLLGLCNDVGLLSEEYDVDARRMVGNFPQAFSHVSLVGTARNLSRGVTGPAERRRRLGLPRLRGPVTRSLPSKADA